MSQRRPPNQRILKQRYEQAVELAKKGQYSKASYLLHEQKDNPKAQKLLRAIEGRNDKLQGGLTNFYSMTIIVMVVLVAVAAFVFYNVATNVRDGFNQRDNIASEFETRGLTGNREMFVDLIFLCNEVRPDAIDTCIEWGANAFTTFNTEVNGCVIVDEGGLQYRQQTPQDIVTCMTERGIPDVYTYVPGAEVTEQP